MCICGTEKRVLRAMEGKRYWRSNTALESCIFGTFDILTVYCLLNILECMKFLKQYPRHFTKDLWWTRQEKYCNSSYLKKNVSINDLVVPDCNLKISNQSSNVMIPRIFNALPTRSKSNDCYKEFIKSVNFLLMSGNFMTSTNTFLVCNWC
jgi:hypothetical protein